MLLFDTNAILRYVLRDNPAMTAEVRRQLTDNVCHVPVKVVAEAVRDRFEFQRMILFGSYARGNAREESDIDVAVVFADYDNRQDRQVELMKLTRGVDTRIEPHPFHADEFDVSNPFVSEIVGYGTEVAAH